MSQNSLTDINVKKIRDATKTDIIFQNILQYIRNGWPNKNKIEEALHAYYLIKDGIVELDGLLLMNNRILIPKCLRREMLCYLHEGHMGIQRCQNLARGSIRVY